MKPALSRILFRPIDPASLAAFRVLFGLLMLVSAGRFFANGWIDRFFVQPSFHFKYWGFSWVKAGPPWAMYLAFGVLAALAALVTLGLFYRVAIVLFFLLFTYLQLIDVTLYLNHYYLVSLLALLLVFVPAHATWSLDARLRPRSMTVPATVPAFALYALRFQVAVVYTSAGLAKLQSDWLLEAQPLNLWLTSLTDFPAARSAAGAAGGALRRRLGGLPVRQHGGAVPVVAPHPRRCLRGGAGVSPADRAAVPDRHVPGHHDRRGHGVLRARLAAPLGAPPGPDPRAGSRHAMRAGVTWRWPASRCSRWCRWCCRSAIICTAATCSGTSRGCAGPGG